MGRKHALLSLAAVVGMASSASATWSIVLINIRTGEVAVGSATCLTNFDLQAGTPVLIPGIGGAAAQSSVDQNGFNRVFIRDRLLEGVAPTDIIDLLSDFDRGHQTRQYGIADTRGRGATFTGDRDGQWAGGVTDVITGQIGDVVYALQGNVLAGEPVVAQTQQTIISAITAGEDIPQTLMLAMQTARSFGGDGRCSCSNNDPDGCGSPPEGWDPETDKAAHIAYMLDARAGDGFGCNSIYKTDRAPVGLAVGDFDNDGWLDLAAACRNASTVNILLNNHLSKHYVTFASPNVVGVTGSVSGVDTADFNKDGKLDFAYADATNGKVGIVLGNGDGTFAFSPLLADAQAGTTWLVVGDFNNDAWPDVAATNTDAGTVSILLNDTTGRLVAVEHDAVGTSPGVIVLGDVDGDGIDDLVCTNQDDDTLSILAGDGTGHFTLWQTIATDMLPFSVAIGDYDGDGRADLACTTFNSRTLQVFRQTTAGNFAKTTYTGTNAYTAIETIDVNHDGFDDIAAAQNSKSGFTLLLGRENQSPEIEGFYNTLSSSNDMVFADFSGDGRGDVIVNARAANGVVGVAGVDPLAGNNTGDGYFNRGIGCATADYYMEFNIAFQKKDDPDPVKQLQVLFDDFRAARVGLVDATASVIEVPADRLPIGSAMSLTIEPRDWQNTPIGPGLGVEAFHSEASAGLVSIGDATDNGDGTYTIVLDAGDLPGEARGLDVIDIRVSQGGQSLLLMPSVRVHVTGPVADWNNDGVVDMADLDAYLVDWNAGQARADLTSDESVNIADLLLFLNIWAGN